MEEPSVDDTVAILRGLNDKYELYHGIKITDEAIKSVVNLSSRYIADRFLPDKAVDLIDEAASALRLQLDSMPDRAGSRQQRNNEAGNRKRSFEKEKKEIRPRTMF